MIMIPKTYIDNKAVENVNRQILFIKTTADIL